MDKISLYTNLTNQYKELSERGLLKISLVGTLIGLVALYFVVGTLVPEKKAISEISTDSIGKFVEVNGIISELRQSEGNIFFKLQGEAGSIKIVLWKNVLDRLVLKGFDLEKIKDGLKIVVEGSVEGYKGEMEIVGKDVELL
ncbi:MAG: exodeoxyribonuclease VII large subunit [Candidatus Aenigmarchaeota archaeon]|nr:exodeoxyribonuclease VII large subunit [Candidatus Aenigmarchaeota archaeon]